MAPTPPESAKASLSQQLHAHARTRWPQLVGLQIRHRGGFAYISAQLPDDDSPLPLFRLRYIGSASTWRFAIYQASSDRYEDSFLPTGTPAGTPEQALDTACGLYLGDPTAWLTDQPPQNQRGAALVGLAAVGQLEPSGDRQSAGDSREAVGGADEDDSDEDESARAHVVEGDDHDGTDTRATD